MDEEKLSKNQDVLPNPKAKYVFQTLEQGLNKATLSEKENKRYRRQSNQIDLMPFLPLQGEDFVRNAFPVTLLRDPDENEMNIFRELIRNGGNNSVLAYIILSSTEIPEGIEKLNIEGYKKAYRRYCVKRKFKNSRFFRWVHAFVVLPTRAKFYFERSHERETQIQKLVEEANTQYNTQQDDLEKIKEEIFEKTDKSIKQLIRMIEQRDIRFDKKTLEYEQTMHTILHSLGDLQNIVIGKARQNKTVITGLPGGITVIQLANCLLGVPSKDWRLAMQLSINEYFEPGEEKLFKSLLKPEYTIVDVGANLGVYTLTALNANCKVYSFEPTPETFELLEQNVLLNNHGDRSFLFQNAVSDREGDIEFALNRGDVGQCNSFFATDKTTEIIKVHTVVLDDVVKEEEKIDIVKIDVEGAEPFVLRGMERIVNKNPDIIIIMEFSSKHLKRGKINPQGFLAEIKEKNFYIYAIDSDTGVLSEEDENVILEAESLNLYLCKKPLDL